MIPKQSKLVLFSANTSLILVLEFIIIKYIQSSFRKHPVSKTLNINLFYRISLFSLFILGILIGIISFQQFYDSYYLTSMQILITTISCGTATFSITSLSVLFISWFKSNRNWIVILYFSSILLIAFNLVITAITTDVKLANRPDEIRSFIGGSVDLSAGRYVFLNDIYAASSILAFISIWITTALLMNSYREKLVSSIMYWIILSLPLVYFLVNYPYQFIVSNILISYLTVDPITVTITLTAFLSLSKPIGGLVFAIAFWKIAKVISYEKNIRTYMNISGWGILLIFGANQAAAQIVSPYPPFGLATITVLVLAGFLMLMGIYNSATLVSTNNTLRKSIYKQVSESRLLGEIGRAEMGKEIERTVKIITQLKDSRVNDTQLPMDVDENELRKYVNFVVKEIKKG